MLKYEVMSKKNKLFIILFILNSNIFTTNNNSIFFKKHKPSFQDIKNLFLQPFKQRKIIHQKGKDFLQDLIADIVKDYDRFYIHEKRIRIIKKIRYHISNNISYIHFYFDNTMHNAVISYNIYDINIAHKVYKVLEYYDIPMSNIEEQTKIYQLSIMTATLIATLYSLYKAKIFIPTGTHVLKNKIKTEKQEGAMTIWELLSCYDEESRDKIQDFINLCLKIETKTPENIWSLIYVFKKIYTYLTKKKIISKTKPIHKNVILYGNGGTGKTTFPSCLRDYLEEELTSFKTIAYIDISATECLGNIYVNSGIMYVKNLFEDIRKYIEQHSDHIVIININEIEQILINHGQRGDLNTSKDDVRNEFKYQLDLLSNLALKNIILIVTSNMNMEEKKDEDLIDAALISRFLLVPIKLDRSRVKNIIRNIAQQYLIFNGEEKDILKQQLIEEISKIVVRKIRNIRLRPTYWIRYILNIFITYLHGSKGIDVMESPNKKIEEAMMPRKLESGFIYVIVNKNKSEINNREDVKEFIKEFKKYYKLWF